MSNWCGVAHSKMFEKVDMERGWLNAPTVQPMDAYYERLCSGISHIYQTC